MHGDWDIRDLIGSSRVCICVLVHVCMYIQYRCQLPRPREGRGEKIRVESGPQRLLTRGKPKKNKLSSIIYLSSHREREREGGGERLSECVYGIDEEKKK